MLIAYFDCFAGASGDMILGALIDAGADPDRLRAELGKLGLPGWSLSAEKVVKDGFAATRCQVLSCDTGKPIDHAEDAGEHTAGEASPAGGEPGTSPPPFRTESRGQDGPGNSHRVPADLQHGPGPGHDHAGRRHAHAHVGPHRHLADILAVIHAAPLAEGVKRNAARVFSRLADAEAKAHGLEVEKVHFHEVGAVDAVVDVVGACAAIEQLGIDRIIVSPLPPGSGVVLCAHGLMPVPTPATAELLGGVPLAPNRNPGELVTPTGAAILTTLADGFADCPPAGMTIGKVGVGAGSRDGVRVPNLLRVFLGELEESGPQPSGTPHDEETRDTVTLLETNLDDIDGVALGHCFGLLLAAGALDVWATPVMMKKNRPAYMMSVLCPAGSPAEAACLEVLFRHTSTFGVRQQRMTRAKLARRQVTVQTAYGPVRVKVGRLGDAVVQAQPEYEDCREASERTGRPLAEIRQAALDAWQQRT